MNVLNMFVVFERRLQSDLRLLIDSVIHKYPANNLHIRKWPPKNFYIYTQGPTGDIALLSSLTQYLKKKYKNIKIFFVTDPKYTFIAKCNPDVEKVIPLKLSIFANYHTIEKKLSKFNCDAFLIATPHPNLRHLIPQLHISKMAFFLLRDLPNTIPTPRLNPPVKNNKQSEYFLINFVAPTFGSHKNTPTPEQFREITNKIIADHPKIQFMIKQDPIIKEEYDFPNARTFAPDFMTILKIALQAKGIINVRSGLNDVVSSMSSVPQFIVYPEGKFPNATGTDCLEWSSLTELGFSAKINEIRINKNDPKSFKYCLYKIKSFIKLYK